VAARDLLTARRIRLILRGTAILLGVGALLSLAARQAVEPAEPFPTALLQVQGLLLTALVFFLTFGQGRLRRACDSVVKEARDWEARAAKAYVERSAAVTTVDVWEWAARDSSVLESSSGKSVIRDAKGRSSLYAKFIDDEWAWERLDFELSASRMAEEPEGTPPGGTSTSEVLYDTARSLGVNGAGVAPVMGHLRIATATSWDQIILARRISWVMLLLLALGVVVSDAGIAAAHDPGTWGSVTLLGLAVAYVAVVSGDRDLEVRATTAALKQSWLTGMYAAEEMLEVSVDDLGTPKRSWREVVEKRVDQARAAIPNLPWGASLAGRLHLEAALRRMPLLRTPSHPDVPTPTFVTTRLDAQRKQVTEALAQAERLLGPATDRGDDPIADLALSRVLWVKINLHESSHEPLRHPLDQVEIEPRARFLTERALTTLDSWNQSGVLTSGQKAARDWARAQAPILRPDLREYRTRFDELTGFVDDRQPPDGEPEADGGSSPSR
jgi:hypothetical protein